MLALNACRQSQDKIVPNVEPSRFYSNDDYLYYNTVLSNKNAAFAVKVKTKEGKPIKIIGNNSTQIIGMDAKLQATIYELLHPDRLRMPRIEDKESNLQYALQKVFDKLYNFINLGKNIIFIMSEHSSRFLNKLINEIKSLNSSIKFFNYPTIYSNEAYLNSELLGVNGEIIPDLSNIKLFISIEADILGTDKFALYYQNVISERKENQADIKLITIESAFTLTGLNSNKRIVINKNNIESLLSDLILQVANKLNYNIPVKITNKLLQIKSNNTFDLNDLVYDILDNRNQVFIKSGTVSSYKTTALTILLNIILNSYQNRMYLAPNSYDKSEHLLELYRLLERPKDILIISLDTDLFYFASSDLYKKLLQIPIENIISFSLLQDSTARNSFINIPLKHSLECWGDAQVLNQNYVIRQPIIEPLNSESVSIEELLIFIKSKIINKENTNIYDELMSSYHLSEEEWINALINGYINNGENLLFNINFNPEKFLDFFDNDEGSSHANLLLFPSLYLGDGSYSTIPWLNELPDPITGVCWLNPVNISQNISKKYDLKEGDVIKISFKDNAVTAPVIINSELADDTIVGYYGYGRYSNKSLPNDEGVNFYNLKDISSIFLNNLLVNIEKTQNRIKISKIMSYVHSNTNANHFICDKMYEKQHKHFFENKKYFENKWIMIIDTTKCIGCNYCILSCQIENNIPFVGMDEILRGRNLHWIRHYVIMTDKGYRNIMVMCQHCENAPCEKVCPVSASTHSEDGLNETTYNRCVGTRYCITNCPYKIRKFNYFNYASNFTKSLNLMLNPSVTVRSRGVVEKCSFCVQRINEYKRFEDASEKIETACQEACPTGAISFLNLKYHQDAIEKIIGNKHLVRLLEEYNTGPSVWYLL